MCPRPPAPITTALVLAPSTGIAFLTAWIAVSPASASAAIEDGIAMVQDGGFYYVIGYGENIDIPTIDVISREISFIGNLVGTLMFSP